MSFRAAPVKAPDHQGAPWLDHSVFHFGAEKYPGPSLLKRALSLQVHLWDTSSAGSFNSNDVPRTGRGIDTARGLLECAMEELPGLLGQPPASGLLLGP